MLKVGIIGIGKRGTQFLNSLSSLPFCKISFICDKNQDKLKIIIDKFKNIKATQNYKDAYKKVDAIIIATPPKTHFEIAKFFLQHKIPILLEKPSTLNVKETEILFDIAKNNNTHIQIGYTERYSPPFQELKNFLFSPEEKNNKNTKIFIEALRSNEFSERIREINVILDLMIHDIDIIMNIIKKEPDTLYGFTSSIYGAHYDFAKVILKFPNNIFAECAANRVSATAIRTITIYKPTSIYKLNFLDQSLTIFSQKQSTPSPDSLTPQHLVSLTNTNNYNNVKVIKNEFKNLIVEEFKEFVSFINTPSKYDHEVDILTLKTVNKIEEKLHCQNSNTFFRSDVIKSAP